MYAQVLFLQISGIFTISNELQTVTKNRNAKEPRAITNRAGLCCRLETGKPDFYLLRVASVNERRNFLTVECQQCLCSANTTIYLICMAIGLKLQQANSEQNKEKHEGPSLDSLTCSTSRCDAFLQFLRNYTTRKRARKCLNKQLR